MTASIFTTASLIMSRGARVDFDGGHQRLVEAQVDAVILTLPRRELAVGGKHAGDVGSVVFVIGRVIELHQVAAFQLRGVLVVVSVVSVGAGGDERKVSRAIGAVFLENEFGIRLQFVFVHARPGVAHGLHDAEPGDARGFTQDGDLARALGAAQVCRGSGRGPSLRSGARLPSGGR